MYNLPNLPDNTIVLAKHWSLKTEGVLNHELKAEWEKIKDQNPDHRVVVEFDYHWEEEQYSIGAYLCPPPVKSCHDQYFKEGRIRIALESIQDIFEIAFGFVNDWKVENFFDQHPDEEPGDDVYSFRSLFSKDLADEILPKNLGPLKVVWLHLICVSKLSVPREND